MVFATLPRPRADDFLVEEPVLVADDRCLVLAMGMFSSAFALRNAPALPALNCVQPGYRCYFSNKAG